MSAYPLDQLRVGRLFVDGHLKNPATGGPLYGRIVSWDDHKVQYDHVMHNDDGSERLMRWNMVHRVFFEEVVESWYEGDEVPVAIHQSKGLPLPLPAKKDGRTGPEQEWQPGDSA